jgi:DNA-directed RNA polymerase specialized sigma24 family protein
MIRLDHLSYEEASAILGITRSAVSANMVRAQRRIRQALAERGFDLPRSFAGSDVCPILET